MTKAGIIFSGAAIAVLIGAGAVAVENGAFTALLSSIGIDRTQTPIISAAPFGQPEVAQSGAIEPVPAPAAPAPVSNESTSGAETAPVLDKAGSVPPAPADARVTGAEIYVPAAEKGLMPWRTALTAAEKAAVARGLKELENKAANPTPSAPGERAATAGLNRKFLAAEEARAKQLQAQQQSQYDEQKRSWEKQQEEYLAQAKSAGNP